MSVYLYVVIPLEDRIPKKEKSITNMLLFDARIKDKEKGDRLPGNTMRAIRKLIIESIAVVLYFDVNSLTVVLNLFLING